MKFTFYVKTRRFRALRALPSSSSGGVTGGLYPLPPNLCSLQTYTPLHTTQQSTATPPPTLLPPVPLPLTPIFFIGGPPYTPPPTATPPLPLAQSFKKILDPLPPPSPLPLVQSKLFFYPNFFYTPYPLQSKKIIIKNWCKFARKH